MRKLLLSLFSLLIAAVLQGQVPEAFKYQAVARDATGAIMANKSVSFRISIIEGTLTGDIVYSEKHNTVTNEFGLVNLEIGEGTVLTGNLPDINWGVGAHFIRVEMDPDGGTGYLLLGTSQLLSVPYALYAKNVENDRVDDADNDPVNEIQSISLIGNELSLTKEGGTVTLPENGDNWGTQIVVTDATLTGSGVSRSPLAVANGGITTLKIADNTILANDLADNSVTVAKISSSGASPNQVIQYSGSDVVWGNPSGTETKVTILNSGCNSIPTFSSAAYSKIVDIGGFTKMVASSKMEITFQGRIWAQTMSGTGAHFELRVDDKATTNGRARANLKAAQAGGTGEFISLTGVFTGLAIGSHTISMWIIGAGGPGTNGGLDPGCWSDDHVIIREIN